MDAIFLLLIVLDVFGHFLAGFFSTVVTLGCFFFVYFFAFHVITGCVQVVHCHGDFLLYPLRQILICIQDALQFAAGFFGCAQLLRGHFAFTIILAWILISHHIIALTIGQLATACGSFGANLATCACWTTTLLGLI